MLKSGAMLPILTAVPSLVWAVIVGSKAGKSFSLVNWDTSLSVPRRGGGFCPCGHGARGGRGK